MTSSAFERDLIQFLPGFSARDLGVEAERDSWEVIRHRGVFPVLWV